MLGEFETVMQTQDEVCILKLVPGVLKPGVPTTRAEVVDLIKEEVNITYSTFPKFEV